jgi:nicotinamidase-related amidase
MLPGSTLVLAVCTQQDFWPGGAWPLVDADQADAAQELFTLAASLSVRQGGICCRHEPDEAANVARDAPPHCVAGTPGVVNVPGCVPALPMIVVAPDTVVPALDRAHAYYVASGCRAPIDTVSSGRVVFDHLTAGIRDAVVFGAGVEHGVARTVDALLRRRVRTHVALDASAAADASEAQHVIAGWKRRGVDGVTVATIARLLRRGAAP